MEARNTRKRIAVVGGGVAGMVTAWLLQPVHEVVLFERNSYLGGHAQSVAGGFDLGAQFISPVGQPTYWRLAHDVLGLKFIRVAGTAALRGPGQMLLWDSVPPYRTPMSTMAMGAMIAAGRNCPWDMTVAEFLSRRLFWLPVSVRDSVLLPWLAVYGNCVISAALETSAYAALIYMTRALDHLTMPYYNAEGGLGAIAEKLQMSDTRICSEVTEVSRWPDGFHIGEEVFDELVLAVHPPEAQKLLAGVLDRDLSGFEVIRATTAIHADPVYMPRRGDDWRCFNAVRHGDYCEASVWYGGLRKTDEQVFKSWTTFRSRQPSEVIATAEFYHPLITPDTIRAQQRLETVQGRDGLWFAGGWTYEADSQESAVISALRISERLGGRTF